MQLVGARERTIRRGWAAATTVCTVTASEPTGRSAATTPRRGCAFPRLGVSCGRCACRSRRHWPSCSRWGWDGHRLRRLRTRRVRRMEKHVAAVVVASHHRLRKGLREGVGAGRSVAMARRPVSHSEFLCAVRRSWLSFYGPYFRRCLSLLLPRSFLALAQNPTSPSLVLHVALPLSTQQQSEKAVTAITVGSRDQRATRGPRACGCARQRWLSTSTSAATIRTFLIVYAVVPTRPVSLDLHRSRCDGRTLDGHQ